MITHRKLAKKITCITAALALICSLCLPAVPFAATAYADNESAGSTLDATGGSADSNQPDASADSGNEGESSDTGFMPLAAHDESPSSDTFQPLADDGQLSPTIIENLSMKWISGYVDDEDVIHITTESITAQFEYEISGSTEHKPGTIRIVLPATAFDIRDGYNSSVESFSLPIPAAPTVEDNEYNWVQEGDSIILTNCKTISAASQFQASITYTIVHPEGVVDMSTTKDIKATMTISGDNQEPVQAESNTLGVQIDTSANLQQRADKQAISMYES